MLKKFKIDTTRDLLVPDFQCYQMDIRGPVNDALEAGELEDLLPSWSKYGENPVKAKGFFTRMLEAVFLGQGSYDELNVDYQIGDIPSRRVAMMFISAKDNKSLNMSAKIAEQTLPGYDVIALNGHVFHNGKRISNRNAEKTVKEILERGNNVLILSRDMAARSFSIPEITELYLAYDKGQNGTTIQKMSRTLTPGELTKIGRIFSLSFDPNRDDKFDAMLVETALNYKKRNNTKSLSEALRDVLRTIDIFKCSSNGAIKLDIDTYLEVALARKGISRVFGKIADTSLMDRDALEALANGNADYFRNQKQDETAKGKTKESGDGKGTSGSSDNKADKKLEQKVREVLTAIIENLDIVILGTNNKILADAMQTIIEDEEMRECVEDQFGLDADIINYLFENDIIKQEWAELMYDDVTTTEN